MKKELLSILFFFLIVLTGVSLFSYNSLDPCIGNNSGLISDNINNAFGILGSYLAGFFIFTFGMGSFWLPFIFAIICLGLLKGKNVNTIWFILTGGLMFMLSTGAFLTLFREQYLFLNTKISSGGILGKMFSDLLLQYTSITGSIIILLFLISAGLVLSTGISIFALILFFKNKIVQLVKIIQEDFKEVVDYVKKKYENNENIEEEILQEDETFDEQNEIDEEFETIKEKKKNSNEPVITKLKRKDSLKEDPSVKFNDLRQESKFNLPSLSFLDEKQKIENSIDEALLKKKSQILENKLIDFNVSGEVMEILPGPVITTFEYKPAPGIKISKIAGLSNDLALALSAISIRIVAPIPGRDVVGIEIPNEERETVNLRELISSKNFVRSSSLLTLALGKDLLGRPVVTNMDSMPHLLIAGATGTGKSVCLNSMILSLLYKAKPDDVKMIMIDPKRIELSLYNDIPHLISPVVTDMKKATNALFWAVKEMERRYELLEITGSRNIVQYNDMVKKKKKQEPLYDKNNEEIKFEKLAYIVVILDELADLMMVASKDVEYALTRLAQMARAAGIHLLIATQRPSVDVLTGSIKANFPTRISFKVSSKVDARTIFDGGGSESLLGNGDMLFCPPGVSKLVRIQGAYVSEKEIEQITRFLKNQKKPDYIEDITLDNDDELDEFTETEYDNKYDEAVALVTKTRQASISFVQRKLRIGYNRAARIIEVMEHEKIIGPQIGSKPREVIVRSYDDT